MSLKFARRAASELLRRGENAVRINPSALEDANKAITKDDVRRLISSGGIFAIKEKHNLRTNAKILKAKRAEGRRRGIGKRKGTRKARGTVEWKKKVRSQRMLLKRLKELDKIDTITFTRFYRHVKGNVYADKASLMLHLKDEGMKLSDEELKQINNYIKEQYRRNK